MTTPEVAELIGNRLGHSLDFDSGQAWGATIRVRVALDVHLPLKWVLKLQTPTVELTVRSVWSYFEGMPEVFGRASLELGAEMQYGAWL
ncbi:UNVERIFIED_CONTAM: hypothetical protein Slati_1469100 [Sesamum latifolium]|uniref:Uncharacterized protein n=1 Tax=Sesamum latifolium TaxID=2727402 RepID=A0AAW2X4K2_9LAMI